MTKRETASFVIRLIAIYIVLRFIAYFPTVLVPFTYMKSVSADLLPAIISTLVALAHPAFCLFIIFKSDKVAAWIVPEDKPLLAGPNLSKDDIMTIGFAMIGLLLLVSVIPRIAEMATKYSFTKSLPDYQAPKYLLQLKGLIAASVVELILGLFLFFGSNALVEFWKRKQFKSNGKEDLTCESSETA